MREIEFRGKRVDNGEWVYGALTKRRNLCGSSFFEILSFENPDESSNFEVETETIGQYTGLKDQNGVKIYEGDIINVKFSGGSERNFIISWEIDRYKLLNINKNESEDNTSGLYGNYCEVIGNIYENPELLGDKNE